MGGLEKSQREEQPEWVVSECRQVLQPFLEVWPLPFWLFLWLEVFVRSNLWYVKVKSVVCQSQEQGVDGVLPARGTRPSQDAL